MEITVLYIHGFSSAGESFTTRMLRRQLPNAKIVSPDLPLNPEEALDLLHNICETEKPDIVVGTSMGGMFAQQMHGFPKILVNPAFRVSEFLMTKLGENQFMFARQDGVQRFMVTEDLANQYAQVEDKQFDLIEMIDLKHTWAMFGSNDDTVNCQEEYEKHYDHFIIYDGEHMLSKKDIIEVLIPLIGRVLKR